MCGDTVAHVPSPDKKEIDRALGAVPVLHGYIFVVYELVDVAAEELDKVTPREIPCHGRFGEPVVGASDDYAIHIFFSLRGPGNLFSRDGSGPPFPSAAFGVPRPRSGHSGAGKSLEICADSEHHP